MGGCEGEEEDAGNTGWGVDYIDGDAHTVVELSGGGGDEASLDRVLVCLCACAFRVRAGSVQLLAHEWTGAGGGRAGQGRPGRRCFLRSFPIRDSYPC